MSEQEDLTTRTAAAPRWIPVSERWPDFDSVVLVVSGGKVTLARVGRDSFGDEDIQIPMWIGLTRDDVEDELVTHWMPLPAPPEG